MPLYRWGYSSIFILLILLSGCQKSSNIQPETMIPGYKASLEFEDTFNTDLSDWIIEGNASVTIDSNGQLSVHCTEENQNAIIWTKRQFEGSFQVEYEIDFPQTNGLASILICAESIDDIALDNIKNSGNSIEISSSMQNYQIYYHGFSADGEHDYGSQIRKNPGHYLLLKSPVDPCKENRFYLIDVAKTGNRIQFFVDNEKIHDLRDRGGFSESLKKGHIGFLIHGGQGFKTFINNVRVFKLSPR
ncbi:DUF1961 family protein [bacterium]|nr:DUF1961 family protein [bacterium]